MLTFFASSSLLSRFGERHKRTLPLAQAKGARRDAWQVMANGGVATLCVLIGQRGGWTGALAAAGADTWATELGLLARRQPRSIISLRSVPAGTSGGVTPEGMLAGLAGALAVGAAAGVLGGGWRTVRTAAVAGCVGSLVDSVLGATLQAVYRCPRCQQTTEEPIHSRCGTSAIHQRGFQWMTNDTVNLLATLGGALIGILGTRPKSQ
jgi:uncharacterized protein (TIGR00297 family)